jgi:predicted Ser/Thr protein kinase
MPLPVRILYGGDAIRVPRLRRLLMAALPRLATLSDTERRDVDRWVAELTESWDEKRLKAVVRTLPPAGDPRRLAALVEMVRIDLEHHWGQGRPVKVESYLRAFPELPAAGLVPDLIQAECAARRRVGAPADRTVFSQRFPDQVELLKSLDRPTSAPPPPPAPPSSTAEGSFTTRATVPPKVVPPLPERHEPAGARALPEQFGRYHILRKLGEGGMGSVYLAHDTQLDRQLALKVPLLRGDSPQVLERFYREARAAATLSHPNICPVHDVGEIDGVHYVTMAYIEGQPLSALIRGKSRMPQKSVAAVIRKLALAMQEAHAHGVIHRDLKPANIMINQRSEPVIMDFGLARRAQEDVRLTQSGAILGTPAFMSPEQVNGDQKAMGPASDVYSLGVILYEMLTGELPFRGPVQAVLGQILTQEPQPPSELRPDLDPALEAICLKAMAKKLSQRYASMRDLAAALGGYLKGEPPAKAPAGPVKARSGVRTAPMVEPLPAGEGLATELLGKLVKRMETDAETIRESQQLAARQQAGSRLLPLMIAVVLLGAVGVVAWLAKSVVDRPSSITVSNTTNNVTVSLALPREASDPNVVLFVLDGRELTRAELSGPMKLSVGDHKLKMRRKDGTYVVSEFTVGKEEDQKVEVPPPQDEAIADAKAPPAKGGAPPPAPASAGWVSLFNGKDMGGWSIYPEGTAGWEIQDGVLVGSGPDSVLFSERGDYRNFHFRVEAQINDGGVAAQVFRAQFEAGSPVGYYGVINCTGGWNGYLTGSVTSRSASGYQTIREKLIKPGEWFTQEVIADANRLVVLVNGKKAVDFIDPGKDYSRGFLGLFKLGKDAVVKFRKIEVRELAPPRPVVRAGAEPGWVRLFNGKDLTGWKPQAGTTAGWEVHDGVLVASGPESVLFSERSYRNCRFRVVAQINDRGTAAQLFRAQLQREAGLPLGYYALINCTGSGWNGYSSGSVVSRGGSSYQVHRDRLLKPNVWFTQEVMIDGNHLVTKVDGERVVDWIDQNNEHKEGPLGLCKIGAGTVVKFRTIEVKELPAK